MIWCVAGESAVPASVWDVRTLLRRKMFLFDLWVHVSMSVFPKCSSAATRTRACPAEHRRPLQPWGPGSRCWCKPCILAGRNAHACKS